jgi:hypothetical protein
MRTFDLAFTILQEVRETALKHANTAARESSSVFTALNSATTGLNANETYLGFVEVFKK